MCNGGWNSAVAAKPMEMFIMRIPFIILGSVLAITGCVRVRSNMRTVDKGLLQEVNKCGPSLCYCFLYY